MDSSGACVLCDCVEDLLNVEVSFELISEIAQILNRQNGNQDEIGSNRKICMFCAGQVRRMLKFYQSHIKNCKFINCCFICGSKDVNNCHKLEKCSEVFKEIVDEFEDSFYKNYDKKDRLCFECTFLVRCWNEMLQKATSKNLVGDVLPMKLLKKVSFSPTKEYIETGRVSPVQLSPLSTPEKSGQPTPKRRKKGVKTIGQQINHLKPVATTLMKGRGRNVKVNNITDTRILNEVSYILISSASQIPEDVLNTYSPIQKKSSPITTNALSATKLVFRGESSSDDDCVTVEDSDQEERVNLSSIKLNTRKVIPKSKRSNKSGKIPAAKKKIKSTFKISTQIFKPNTSTTPVSSPSKVISSCRDCKDSFKNRMDYKLHVLKHECKKELLVKVCRRSFNEDETSNEDKTSNKKEISIDGETFNDSETSSDGETSNKSTSSTENESSNENENSNENETSKEIESSNRNETSEVDKTSNKDVNSSEKATSNNKLSFDETSSESEQDVTLKKNNEENSVPLENEGFSLAAEKTDDIALSSEDKEEIPEADEAMEVDNENSENKDNAINNHTSEDITVNNECDAITENLSENEKVTTTNNTQSNPESADSTVSDKSGNKSNVDNFSTDESSSNEESNDQEEWKDNKVSKDSEDSEDNKDSKEDWKSNEESNASKDSMMNEENNLNEEKSNTEVPESQSVFSQSESKSSDVIPLTQVTEEIEDSFHEASQINEDCTLTEQKDSDKENSVSDINGTGSNVSDEVDSKTVTSSTEINLEEILGDQNEEKYDQIDSIGNLPGEENSSEEDELQHLRLEMETFNGVVNEGSNKRKRIDYDSSETHAEKRLRINE